MEVRRLRNGLFRGSLLFNIFWTICFLQSQDNMPFRIAAHSFGSGMPLSQDTSTLLAYFQA